LSWRWLRCGNLRPERQSPTLEELANFEADVMAGFVLARASAGW
jgi:hypothetical protein